MGWYDNVKKKYFEKDPDQPQKDPQEKGARLGFRIVVILFFMVVLLLIEWWQGWYDNLQGATWLFGAILVAATTVASYVQLALSVDSPRLIDQSGMDVPILGEAPIELDTALDEFGESRFKMDLLLVDEDSGDSLVSELVEVGYDCYRGGIDSTISWARDIVYIVPRLIVKVKDFKGNTHLVNVGTWKQGPKKKNVNGKLHKYRYWKDVPDPFKMALTRKVPYFNESKFRVRICPVPAFNFPTMRQLRMPADLMTTLAVRSKETQVLRESHKAIGDAYVETTKHIRTKAGKGEVEGGRPESQNHGEEGGY
jgi:hypothetical protein